MYIFQMLRVKMENLDGNANLSVIVQTELRHVIRIQGCARVDVRTQDMDPDASFVSAKIWSISLSKDRLQIHVVLVQMQIHVTELHDDSD